ncbi:MAG: Uma2 family endonuclease [Bryobacteraceae bacterium]|nr:Uma2 family endonuclease [Bryobacteraceae bacterium]
MVYEIEESYLPITLTAPAPMTDEQFLAFCEKYPDDRIEMTAEGDILIMPPAGFDSGLQNNRISMQLIAWADADGRGAATDSSTGFVLPNGARRSPDASWTRFERIDGLGPGATRGFAHLVPDFAIELRSPSDRLPALRRKMLEYIANGAQLGWLIDPQRRTVEIYRPDREPEILVDPQSVAGEGPVEGFRLNLARVWNLRG